MPVVCVEGKGFENSFEKELFETLCRDLNREPEPYFVHGPLWLQSGNEIDGLLITPRCIFTLEAKNIRGHIYKDHLNAPIRADDEYGIAIDLSDRHRDPFQQAASQWFGVRDAITASFGEQRVFVKSMLIFPTGTLLNVPSELQDPTNQQAPAYILTANEVAGFAGKFYPGSFWAALNAQTQRIIIKALAGPGQITSAEKREVTVAIAAPAKPEPAVSSTAPTELVQLPVSPSDRTEIPASSVSPNATTKRDLPASPQSSGGFMPPVGRFVGIGLLAALSYFSLRFWLAPLTSGGLSLLLFLLLWYGRWGFAVYTYLGGLMFGFVSKAVGMGLLISILAAVFWPLSLLLVGFLFVTGGNLLSIVPDNLPSLEDFSPATIPAPPETAVPDALTSTPAASQNESQPAVVEETPTAEDAPPTQTAALQVRIQGNSNVRAGPSTAEEIVGIALNGQVFSVLEKSLDGNWYKIELEPGKIGWIGSSRVQEIR